MIWDILLGLCPYYQARAFDVDEGVRLCEGVEGGPDATSAPRAAVIVPEDEAAGLEHLHGES